MVQLAKNQKEYFLGVDGEQKGPFTQDQVSQMLETGEINIETQIWSEGMTDWQSIGTVKEFKSADFELKRSPGKEEKSSVVFEESVNRKTSSKESEAVREVFRESNQNGEDDFEPLFSSSDSHVAIEQSIGKSLKFGLVLGALCALAGGYYFWQVNQLKPQSVEVKPKKKMSQSEARRLALSALQTEFNKDPEATVPKMIDIIKANPSDNAGLEALEIVSSYYRQRQLYSEVGEVLLVAQRPLEALELFKKDPPNYAGMERAYEAAESKAQGSEKRELLLNQISVLIKNLGRFDKALEKIRVLDGAFPGTQHPYQYYLKSNEQKIADLFSRISFHFSDSLNSFINAELNYIQFLNKPLIQVTKDKTGKYRIVATYKGIVNLRNDRVPNTFFVFWFWNDQWLIADTNITKERSKFAQDEQKKHMNEVLSDVELLTNMETIFRTKFPGKAVHEAVSLPKRSLAEGEE